MDLRAALDSDAGDIPRAGSDDAIEGRASTTFADAMRSDVHTEFPSVRGSINAAAHSTPTGATRLPNIRSRRGDLARFLQSDITSGGDVNQPFVDLGSDGAQSFVSHLATRERERDRESDRDRVLERENIYEREDEHEREQIYERERADEHADDHFGDHFGDHDDHFGDHDDHIDNHDDHDDYDDHDDHGDNGDLFISSEERGAFDESLFATNDIDANYLTNALREDSPPPATESEPEVESDYSSTAKRARLEPRDPEMPVFYDVPVDEFPEIDWTADVFEGQPELVEQELELTESESESDYSDAGSVAEMIDDSSSSESEREEDGEAEFAPSFVGDGSGSDSDYTDDELEPVSLNDLELNELQPSELSDDETPKQETIADLRRQRPKRHRVETLRDWLGERIEYKAVGKRMLLTAVDVRKVEEPVKQPKRRPRRRRTLAPADFAAFAPSVEDTKDINVEVYDSMRNIFRDETVARSLQKNFVPLVDQHNKTVPNVFRSDLFGGGKASLQQFVLRIQRNGEYRSPAEYNLAHSFVVWQGTCSVNINGSEFVLTRGRACRVPRGNDLVVTNKTESDVFLFVISLSDSGAADMLARDAETSKLEFPSAFDSPEQEDALPSEPLPSEPILHSAPSPVQSAPSPVQSAPSPVQSAPSPVQSAPSPVQSAPSPVQSVPSAIHSDTHSGPSFERYMDSMAPALLAPEPVREPVMEPRESAESVRQQFAKFAESDSLSEKSEDFFGPIRDSAILETDSEVMLVHEIAKRYRSRMRVVSPASSPVAMRPLRSPSTLPLRSPLRSPILRSPLLRSPLRSPLRSSPVSDHLRSAMVSVSSLSDNELSGLPTELASRLATTTSLPRREPRVPPAAAIRELLNSL